jgi:hypothetical protein
VPRQMSEGKQAIKGEERDRVPYRGRMDAR